EIKQYGEYRTRRLVLEAWERLVSGEAVNSERRIASSGEDSPIHVDARVDSVIEKRSEPAEEVVREEPKPVKREEPVEVKQETPLQPALSDFGLYKCKVCGKMVMGYDQENHTRSVHGGKVTEYAKIGK